MLEQGETALEPDGTRIHDQKIAGPLGPRWIAWREALVRSDASRPAEMQCVGRDVTDRTETERALAEARDLADSLSWCATPALASRPRPRRAFSASSMHHHDRLPAQIRRRKQLLFAAIAVRGWKRDRYFERRTGAGLTADAQIELFERVAQEHQRLLCYLLRSQPNHGAFPIFPTVWPQTR